MMASIFRLPKIREKARLSAEVIELVMQIARGESEDSGPSEVLEVVEDPMEVESNQRDTSRQQCYFEEKKGLRSRGYSIRA